MVEKVKRNKVLTKAAALFDTEDIQGYSALSVKYKNDRILEVANKLLSRANRKKLQRFCQFMEDKDCNLLHTNISTFPEEFKESYIFTYDLHKVVQPLNPDNDQYLQTELPVQWGECSAYNEKAVAFVSYTKLHNLAFWIGYKICIFDMMNYRNNGNPALADWLLSTCLKCRNVRSFVSSFLDGEYMVKTVREARNHVEIGKRLGFDDYAQAVYDALDMKSTFMYDSQYVDLTRELSQWTYHTPHNPLPSHIDFARLIVQKANDLKVKYQIKDEWEEDAYSYLINELLKDYYPEDDDVLTLDDLDEDLLCLDEEETED